MSSWADLARHGPQTFSDLEGSTNRRKAVEAALNQWRAEALIELGNSSPNGLQVALGFRKRTEMRQVSFYEGLNQLLHYWHCCVAAQFLFLKHGALSLTIIPTAQGGENHDPDLNVELPNQVRIACEVFCVSESLFGSKNSKTVKKLKDHHQTADGRWIFFNADAKPRGYSPKTKDITYYSIDAAGDVNRIAPMGRLIL